MELYAKMLMFGNTNVNQRFSSGSAFQFSKRQATNFRSPNRPCFAFNKGACKMPAGRCTYAHKCLKCDKFGHPSTRCFQGTGQGTGRARPGPSSLRVTVSSSVARSSGQKNTIRTSKKYHLGYGYTGLGVGRCSYERERGRRGLLFVARTSGQYRTKVGPTPRSRVAVAFGENERKRERVFA